VPTYEYMCEKCDHEFEREQRISDPPVKTCPECRSRKVKKLISRTSFVLKGGGWYSDLYSSTKPESGGDKSDGESKAASSKDSETKTDSKPSDSKKTKDKSSKSPSSASSKKGKSAA
jgi:putative FmdB family regulatory protein